MKYPSIKEALERAEIRAQELPHVVQVKESDWDVVVLANEVKRLNRELDRFSKKVVQDPKPEIHKINPYIPRPPWIPVSNKNICPTCGLSLEEGPMGYCCPVPRCPTGLGGAWSSSNTVD